ncbi:unnamed protein product [Ectocarpus sp. 8 AP-2014]
MFGVAVEGLKRTHPQPCPQQEPSCHPLAWRRWSMTSPGVVPGCASGGCAAAGGSTIAAARAPTAVTCSGAERCGDDGGELGAFEAPKSGSTTLLDLADEPRGSKEPVGAVGVGLSGRRSLVSPEVEGGL